MKFTKLIPATLCLTLIASPALATNGAQEQLKASLTQASKAEKLPNANSVVVFGGSESVVLTDNPRWVIKGQLYDMWQNTEINSKLQLHDAAKKIPIQTINVNTTDVVDIRVNPEKSEVLTVFLDPFLEHSANEMYLLNKYAADYQIRYIFTAMSQSNIKLFFSFACETQTLSTDQVIEKVVDKQFAYGERKCREVQVMNSFGLTQFLHIKESPTLIAPNDVFHVGMPTELLGWLRKNTK